MQATSFHHLQANLSEIYASLDGKVNADELSIYASSFFHIYFPGCLTGQIMIAMDKAWSWLMPPSQPTSVKKMLKFTLTTFFDYAVHYAYDVRQRRIGNNMRQIDQIWKKHLQPKDFSEQHKRYANFLSQELTGSSEVDNPIYLANFDARVTHPLMDQEVKAMRHTIINFHQATHLVWSLFIKNRDDNLLLRQPLMAFIKPTSSTLVDRALFKALKKEERWVQLEGFMEQAIPVALFAKLEDFQSLSVEENRYLKGWVQTLNRCQQAISPQFFSGILAEIMNVIYLQGSSSLTLLDLLYWLDQQGCQIIHREDPAHMDWREKLQPGDSIECNGKQLILGLQLSPDKLIDDNYKVFELEEYPDYVVKIALNRFLLLIEERKANNEQDHWGVRLVETIANLEEDDQEPVVGGLDQQGRCVVLEKLSSSFDSYIWTSDDMQLTQEDERSALVFANHLFCMSQWKSTAQNLSLPHLMWDKEGMLKSTRLLKKGSANYNEWENYCENAAKGNPYILSFLMHVSKLNEHEMALYYREVCEYTLETEMTDLIGRPLPLGHRQDIYRQHAKKLCAQAKELRQNCIKIIIAQLRKKKQYSYKQQEQLKTAIVDKLLEFYRASPTPGRLSADIEQQVIASFTQHSPSNASLPDPSDVQDYYQEQYELMIEYNQASIT